MSSNQTLAISGGYFRFESEGGKNTLVSSSSGQTTVVETKSGGTLEEIQYKTTDPSINTDLKLQSSQKLVLTESKLQFGAESDTLLIATTGAYDPSNVVASESQFNLGDGINSLTFKGSVNEIAVVGGKDSDTIKIDGNANQSSISLRGGGDNVVIQGKATETKISLGDGGDLMRIQGDVKQSSFTAGKGNDTLIFGGNITDSTINLGGKTGGNDRIELSTSGTFKGLHIVGANNGDILVIGSTQYNYSESSKAWENTTNPQDKLKF